MKLISPLYAQDSLVPINTEINRTNFFGYKCIGDLISKGVDLIIIVSGVSFFVLLVWGGVEWMTAGSDKGHVENAQKRITNALIGLTIVAAAWAIWNIALTFFGIEAVTCDYVPPCTHGPCP